MSHTVVIGGRRSGKSAVAERLLAGAPAVTYVAPLTVTDDEMAARVATHRSRRPAHWRTVESADPVAVLRSADAGTSVLLDSLGTWISEVLWRSGMLEEAAPPGSAEVGRTLLDDIGEWAALAAARSAPTVTVVEEAGWGPVPPSAAARRWLDTVGDAAQRCTAHADRVLLTVAGRTLELP